MDLAVALRLTFRNGRGIIVLVNPSFFDVLLENRKTNVFVPETKVAFENQNWENVQGKRKDW